MPNISHGDGYLLALAANTLLNTNKHKAAGRSAARRLAAMQSPGGAWTNASHSITLVATIPGTYTDPASSAYLYYTDEHKTWVKPVTIKITK